MTTAKLSEDLASLGEKAFYSCSSLRSIDLGGLKDVGTKAFANCSSLSSVAMSAKKIGGWAFLGCVSLKEIDISDAEYIGASAFSGCKLWSAAFSKNLSYVGSNAFYGTAFTDESGKTVQQTVSELRGKTLRDLPKTGDKMTSGGLVFTVTGKNTASVTGYSGTPTSITVPKTVYVRGIELKVTSIGTKALYGCSKLTLADIGNVYDIGLKAFANCPELKAVIGTPTKVGDWAFTGCASLWAVNLSSSVSIGTSAFSGCTSLASADLRNVSSLGDKAFYGCSALESVSLDNLAEIGTKSFANCVSLKTASISAFKIKGWSFTGCVSLRSIDLSATKYIGTSAFSGCKPIESITFADGLSMVGNNAFYGLKFQDAQGNALTVSPENLTGHSFSKVGGYLRLVK